MAAKASKKQGTKSQLRESKSEGVVDLVLAALLRIKTRPPLLLPKEAPKEKR